MNPSLLGALRKQYHADLMKRVLREESGVPSNADKHNPYSVEIAHGIFSKIGKIALGARLSGQSSGSHFEAVTSDFIEKSFLKLNHLRPGRWSVKKVSGKSRLEIARFDQYTHLVALDKAAKENPELAAALGSDYTITPDIVIARDPEEDKSINANSIVVDDGVSNLTSLRRSNNPTPILHASISCKWTIRSDRAQNARSEALNLVRNRKGKLPHIVVVTGEPLPSRIASIALGTGDIDCVYHFALYELTEAVHELGFFDAEELLKTMVNGKRLRDISDLPLDLVI